MKQLSGGSCQLSCVLFCDAANYKQFEVVEVHTSDPVLNYICIYHI